MCVSVLRLLADKAAYCFQVKFAGRFLPVEQIMAVSNSNSWNWADSLTQQLRAKKNSHTVRWYVLVLPVSRHGHYQGNPARALQAELDRRMRGGETLFEFFAPSYVEVRERHGQLVRTNHPLLYNYVFIHASESEIYRMKRFLPQYNFLPRIRDAHGEYYPYLSDEAMRNLRWVAESYSDVLPVYTPGPDRLMKGDRIRITEGQFKGVEATVIIQPGAGRKEVMVCVENCMYVPLLSVEPGQYEVVAECRQPPRLHATERRPYSDGAPRGAPALSLSGRSDGGGSGPGHGGAAAIRQPAVRKRRDALQIVCPVVAGLCHSGRSRAFRTDARHRAGHPAADPGRTVAGAAARRALRLYELLSGLCAGARRCRPLADGTASQEEQGAADPPSVRL